MDFSPGQWYVAAMMGFLFMVMLLLYAVFRAKDNPIYCWQLIASKNAHGEDWADIDKLGKLVALIVITAIAIFVIATAKVDWTPLYLLYLVALFLLYAGGISGFSAWLRSKQPPIPGPPIGGETRP